MVVTDLGTYHFDEDGEMRLDSLHPGVSLDDVRESMGWHVRTSSTLSMTPAPSTHELHLIREVLDPDGRYTG